MVEWSYVDMAALQLLRDLVDRKALVVVCDTGRYENDPYLVVKSVVPSQNFEPGKIVLMCDPSERWWVKDGKLSTEKED
jgi:hypothetical protein